MSSRFSRAVNRKLLLRQLRPIVEAMTGPPIVVTTVPVVADLIGVLPARRWVYYCVDDFAVWPGLDHASIRDMEAVLVRKAHDVIAVSENLQNRLAEMGRDAHLLTHGVDINHWINGEHASPASVDGLARPLVVFWGVVDRRMDTDLVRHLSDSLHEGTIVLAGPLSTPDPALLRLSKVVTPGSIPYDQLPALAREAAVLIMPYADTPVNRAIQPLKLKEYLATGRPVVVRDLPANREWRDCLDLVRSPAEFADTVCRRIRSGLSPHQQAARERLAGESWDVKAPLFEHWVIRQAPEIATAC